MKRYLLTSDKCPPCIVLHEREEERLESIEEIEVTDDDELDKVERIIRDMEEEIDGIPALLEVNDDGNRVSVGLNDVANRLKEISEIGDTDE